ncbi:EamA family transporter [Flavobacterium kingsejongi]|uniref:EamA family transporter n=1 Tax=Flavobacterium kingsejongi TaxID=1678728 RepID=A0A2S1LNU4_9FLAO|nr:DMT family transporter [Flavobacterium kingsejongi]AWG25425.1 EamA family transporter [Flavobacterium kingsejongi]
MSGNTTFKGILLVALGASSYGMLATFVKMAYDEGYTTSEVTLSQFALGILGMLLINLVQRSRKKNTVIAPTRKNIIQLMAAGTSLGFTSLFYYLAVRYIPVSIGIVLLMQTVWMSVVLEMTLTKKLPSVQKIVSTLIVLAGTVLATNILKNEVALDWRGIMWGVMAAVSFTMTMFTSNRIATELSSAQRSLFMLIGGSVVITGFAIYSYEGSFNFDILLRWGIILSLFGTIIPPMLLTAGFPKTGIGLGSIVSSLELPVSVMMAYVLLKEPVNALQWLGIVLILLAIVIMNIRFGKRQA